MNTKKFLLTLTLFAVAAYITLPLLASAQPTNVPVGSVDDIKQFLKAVLGIFRAIFFALAAIFVVLAAWNYLTAGGDPTKVAAAKTMLIYTAVAIAIALIANSLQTVIADLIGRRA